MVQGYGFRFGIAAAASVLALLSPAISHPATAAQNGKLAYLRGPYLNASTLAIANADGTAENTLAIKGATGVSWSPDGTKIAWSGVAKACSSLYVSNADGSATTQVLPSCGLSWAGLDPVWSPDGKKLAFWMYTVGGFDTSSIYLVDLATKAVTQLTSKGQYDEEPSWSPDGTKIAFIRTYPDGNGHAYGFFDVWVMNADGSDLRNLTNIDATLPGWHVGQGGIDWSPDGTKIACTEGGTAASGANVVVMNSDGSGAHSLTSGGPGYWSINPVWSPDGTKIAFVAGMYGDGSDFHPDVYVMDADGSHQAKIIANAWAVAWGTQAPAPTSAPPIAKPPAHKPPAVKHRTRHHKRP